MPGLFGSQLKAYNPTIRDKLAMMIVGDSKPGSMRQQFSEGLLGSTGTGTRGGGMIDYTPFGLPMQAQEAGRQMASKNQGLLGAVNLASMLLPIPMAKGAAKGTAKRIAHALPNPSGMSAALDMSQAARMGRAADQGFTTPVFHGTPDARDILASGRFQTPRERIGYPTDELWAAKDRKTASSYADPKRAFDYQNSEPATLEAMMRLKNPMEIDGGGQSWRGTREAVAEARSKGHDGVIVRNVIDDYTGKGRPTTTYAVFDSNGIKLASDPFHPGGEARVGLPRPGDFRAHGLSAPPRRTTP